jgi:Arc/MetJ-type ribon-helix-helix transcriptional regulator
MLISKYDYGMSPKGRITVTLDQELIDEGNAAVAAGRAHSLSAWINAVLEEHRGNERRLTVLAQLIAEYEAKHGAFTAEELAEQERQDRRNAIVIRGSGRGRRAKGRSRAR